MADEHVEEVKQAVHDLAEAVTQMREGLVDEEKVKSIVAELIAAQRAADVELNGKRSGYRPEDTEGEGAARLGQGAARLTAIQSREARAIAPLVGRPVSDVVAFQQAGDNVVILDALIRARRADGEGVFAQSVKETAYYRDEYLPLVQAMDTATAAEGLEFVPKELSANLIERISLQLRVAALFPTIEMPTNPFDIPGRAVARVRLGKASEQTADTGQTGFKKVTPGSRKITLTAMKFAGEALVSKEAEEDAIVAMLPFIQSELVDYMAADYEDTIVNGDTAGTMDTGWASDDPRKNFDGLRKLAAAGAKTDIANVAPTVALTIRATRKKMAKYAVDPAQLVHLCSISAYLQLLSDANLYTVDKYGLNATLLAGELGRVDGSPILVSEYVRQDLNASGVFDNVTTNRTEVISVNRRGWVLGNRRGLTIQVLRELYAEYDQDAIIASHRKAFAAWYPTATEFLVGIAYNVAS